MEDLTPRQRRIMDFLLSHLRRHGYPPTMREIGAHFGFTWPAARGHLNALQRKGFIRLSPQKSRGIEIMGHAVRRETLDIPVAGRIRAGSPSLAFEETDGHITVDRKLFGDDGAFALRASGESMVEAGIFDGDYVIVSPAREVASGDIGVFLIGDEATVKRASISKETITLVPANSSMSPVSYKASEVQVMGKVVGVIRRL